MENFNRVKIGVFFMLLSQLAYSKSPCYDLATTAFFNSSLWPAGSTPESLKDARDEMTDGETLCKRLVQSIKTKKTTSDEMRVRSEDFLKKAKDNFEHDGDMDKYELSKYHYELIVGSAKIADEYP